jgi:hypothetical protein
LTKTNPCQTSLRNGFELKFVPDEILCLVHFRTGLELAVELERPGVVGAEEDSRVPAIGPPRGGHGAAVSIVAKTGRHDIHRAMRTDAREDADGTVLVAHDDQRLPQEIEVEEVPPFGNLRNMRQALPAPAQERGRFPVEELLAGVSGGGKRAGLGEREVGGGADPPLDFRHGHRGLRAPGLAAIRVGQR